MQQSILINSNRIEKRIEMYHISKIGAVAFLLDILWFKYAHFESSYVLYGTAALAIFPMASDLIYNKETALKMFPYGVLVNIILCVYSLLTGFFVARSQEYLFSSLQTYAIYSLFCMTICYVSAKEGSIKWLMKTLALAALLCAAYSVFRGTYRAGYGYVLNSSMNPNNFGLILLLGIYGILSLCKYEQKGMLLTGALLSFLTWRIIACGSRKSMIAAIALLFIWAYIYVTMIIKSNKYHHAGLSIFILGVVFAGVLIYVYKNYLISDSFNRMQLLGSGKEESSAMRKYYYNLAISLFANSPLFGVGFNQFQLHSSTGLFSHSLYAESIACLGLVGCLIYFPPIFIGIFKSWKSGFRGSCDYRGKLIFGFFIVELFLGIGQVLYYEICHLILLSSMFIWLEIYNNKPDSENNKKNEEIRNESKYIR